MIKYLFKMLHSKMHIDLAITNKGTNLVCNHDLDDTISWTANEIVCTGFTQVHRVCIIRADETFELRTPQSDYVVQGSNDQTWVYLNHNYTLPEYRQHIPMLNWKWFNALISHVNQHVISVQPSDNGCAIANIKYRDYDMYLEYCLIDISTKVFSLLPSRLTVKQPEKPDIIVTKEGWNTNANSLIAESIVRASLRNFILATIL